MRTTFKQFLAEGGAATDQFNTVRATKEDIEKALDIVGRTLNLPDIKERVLGSVPLVLAGKKKDSGDIDIVVTDDEMDVETADQKMMQLTNNEGSLNKGTKIGSYAVDVGGKKVQVDLMFVKSKEWAKFIYHSTEGENSKYPGAVRNIILMAAVRHKHEAGKDFLIKVDNEVVARASRALKLDTGLERLFKMARKKKDGTFNKTMDKVTPEELKQYATELAKRDVPFTPDPEIIDMPDEVAAWIFGSGVKAADLMTAEQVIVHVKKLKNATQVISDARRDLKEAKLPIPTEL